MIIIICESLTDRDDITESHKDCLDGVNKNIVASTNKPNKIKRAPGVATTVLPPENCSSDVSMEVDKGKVCVLLFLFSYYFHQDLFS